MAADLLGVIDIGKTQARLLLVDAETGSVEWSRQRASTPCPGPLVRQLDVSGVETWLTEALRSAPDRHRITCLIPIAHGAAGVLLDADGNALLAPDYEDPAFDETAAAYRPLRDEFTSTYSPFLPLGLNLGRQLHHIETRHPALWSRVRMLLTYPQYWAWRLGGVAASELTSLGCHSDLWRPAERRYTNLAMQRGWQTLMPPVASADQTLGTITHAIAATTGLDPACRVLCGIHDSNASYFRHLHGRTGDDPFCVISSGTWTVLLAHGAPLSALREEDDMLANVDARGNPTPTARFMGGREYRAIAGEAGAACTPDRTDLNAVIDQGAMALPAFATAGGPYAARTGRFIHDAHLSASQRAALAAVYVALMTDLLLDRLQAGGDTIVDGPLAANSLYCSVLASLRPRTPVWIGDIEAGTADAGRRLAGCESSPPALRRAAPDVSDGRFDPYRDEWRLLVQRG